MITILLLIVADAALFLIGLGMLLEWRKRFNETPKTPAQQARYKVGLILLSIPAVITLIGPLIIVAGQYHQMRYNTIMDWPTTPGEVTGSYVQVYSGKGGPTYKPAVSYTYTVNNQTYTGSKLAYDTRSFHNRSKAEAEIRPYPSGQSVTIHYNPDKPNESLLARTPDSFFQMYTLMGVIVTLVAGLILGGGSWGLARWVQPSAPRTPVIRPLDR